MSLNLIWWPSCERAMTASSIALKMLADFFESGITDYVATKFDPAAPPVLYSHPTCNDGDHGLPCHPLRELPAGARQRGARRSAAPEQPAGNGRTEPTVTRVKRRLSGLTVANSGGTTNALRPERMKGVFYLAQRRHGLIRDLTRLTTKTQWTQRGTKKS